MGDDFVSYVGLSVEEIQVSMNSFLPELFRCVPPGAHMDAQLQVEVTVGCDGRVDDVFVADGGSLDASLASCVVDTLQYVGFPAHDTPEGVGFLYPMNFRF